MKKLLLSLLFFILFLNAYCQSTLNTYFPPGYRQKDTIQNPPITPKLLSCGMIDTLKVGSNNDFMVRVRSKATDPWLELFEYNAFVLNASNGLQVARSSFVSFDYSGTVIIEIKCNKFGTIDPNKLIIRPQSRVISKTVLGNKITLTLTAPTSSNYSDKLSVEINGNRYNNLQIFANKPYAPPASAATTSFTPTITYSAGGNGTSANVYAKSLNSNLTPKKIIIQKGAIVSVPYAGPVDLIDNGKIIMNNGDELYIEGGGVLNGGVIACDKVLNGGVPAYDKYNIKVYGRGMIDLTNYPKKYQNDDANDYAYIQPFTFRGCKNITLDGLIINDSQQICVELKDCGGTSSDAIDNININNMKLFSHAIWGDGFQMKGTSNVSINDCFNRTSDDCISIYASRRDAWQQCDTAYNDQVYNDPFVSNPSYPAINGCFTDNFTLVYQNRDALNIKVTNTLLYADKAHAIEIGWHGNQFLNNGNNIYNLHFENIDILEHDQNWVEQNGTVVRTYDGAIGITCSDDNKCSNFLFKDIRIEDFTAGNILTLRVMPYGEGDAVKSGKSLQDVRFENIFYTGTGERKSRIEGVNCDRFVNGVHFQNFKIKTSPNSTETLVTSSNWLNYFETNPYAYNITFQEANNYGNDFTDPYAIYVIKNYQASPSYTLQNVAPYVNTAATTPVSQNKLWKIVPVTGSAGEKWLIPYYDSGKSLENFSIQDMNHCNGRYLTTATSSAVNTNQQWKIPGNSTAGYRIINAYTKAYLTYLTDPNLSNVLALPKDDTNPYQVWKIEKYTGTLPTNKTENPAPKPALYNLDNESIQIFPNPTKSLLNINNVKNFKDTSIEIIDLNGKKIMSQELKLENTLFNIENLSDGIYIVKVINNSNEIYSQKIIKN